MIRVVHILDGQWAKGEIELGLTGTPASGPGTSVVKLAALCYHQFAARENGKDLPYRHASAARGYEAGQP